MRNLFIRPIFGLANRLRTIASAYALAQESGRRLRVYWTDTPDCHAKWTDILKIPAEFDVVDVNAADLDVVEPCFVADNPNFFSRDRAKEFISACRSNCDDDYAHENFKPFFPNGNYDWLKPIESVQAEINQFKQLLGPETIGIHIRRTDNKEARFMSPTRLFKEKIAAEITASDNAKFFLATDDDSEKVDICATFPCRVFTRDNVHAREADGGIRDALIDLCLLASAKRIYGTFWSSFSREAARIGGAELIVVDDKSKVAVSIVVNLDESPGSLERCLNSLITQWLFRIEIICVSGDATQEMLDIINSYAGKDSRVSSVADMSEALRVAKGKYLFVMRSNEVAQNNLAKVLFEFSEENQFDVVLFKANRYFGFDYDQELVERLNKKLRANFCWKRLHKRRISFNQACLIGRSVVADEMPLAAVFSRTELCQTLGHNVSAADFREEWAYGMLSTCFASRPVWSGNRIVLEAKLRVSSKLIMNTIRLMGLTKYIQISDLCSRIKRFIRKG